MFEKVNPSHPDKVADRIAGAIVDYAYKVEEDPRIAVEVLLGHGDCNIICESSVPISYETAYNIVYKITGEELWTNIKVYPQDVHLSHNQEGSLKCGDNGIFKGTPVTDEQRRLTSIAKSLYKEYPHDGKYIINDKRLIICQSHCNSETLRKQIDATINPLGDWSGGSFVDSGATNRKLGSDMGDSVTGGGLHGKDFSKADVSVNIYAWLKAQELNKEVKLFCAIGDTEVDGIPYAEIVKVAKDYVMSLGGFEKFAEWGLIN